MNPVEVPIKSDVYYTNINASDRLISYVKYAKEDSHNRKFSSDKQTILYYALAKGEEGRIGANAIAFIRSRGDLLLLFLIEYDLSQKVVRIVDPYDKSQQAQKWLEWIQTVDKLYKENFNLHVENIYTALHNL